MEEPLYNIGIVARLTGVPIPSLHGWERRYGFPVAARSSGGHRLYSERDIARLRWVKDQIDSGMTVSRAIAAARSMEADGRLLLPLSAQATALTRQGPVGGRSRTSLLEALLAHDLAGADSLMGEMLAFHSPEDLTLDMIGPTLVQIGEAWEQGRITVATEHLASNYLRHRLLMWMVTGPPARPGNPVILACAPDEWHEGSLLMLGVLLRRRGWPVAYLGQNVPFPDLARFATEIHPPAVVLVAMRAETARALGALPDWLPWQGARPVLCFGGAAFVVEPGLKNLVPGTYLGDSLGEGLQRLEAILH